MGVRHHGRRRRWPESVARFPVCRTEVAEGWWPQDACRRNPWSTCCRQGRLRGIRRWCCRTGEGILRYCGTARTQPMTACPMSITILSETLSTVFATCRQWHYLPERSHAATHASVQPKHTPRPPRTCADPCSYAEKLFSIADGVYIWQELHASAQFHNGGIVWFHPG